jgi:leader peptidase (prepilin peptidase) / N-methyltransferase
MSRFQIVDTLLHIMAFMMGAGIGSFLNVVIYRLPLGISVNNPRRSFCPSCKKQIAWYHNLPLFTWLWLRGKCASCGSKIAFRYFFVELLTGCVFYAIFLKFRGPWELISNWGDVVLIYWIFASLLIAGTYIDLDYYLLPHEITLGGLGVGLLGSFIAPEIMGELEHGRGMVISFVSACIGLGLLWTVVELGKLAFGRVKHQYEKPELWSITQPDEKEPPVFTSAGEALTWADIFTRPSDRLIITCSEVTVNEKSYGQGIAEIKMETMKVKPTNGAEETFKLEGVTVLHGKTTQIVIPREAMGFGDVLLLAMIGSFLGWQAVLFTIVAASVIGCFFAIVPRLIGQTEWATKIPFGPYLAGGAMIWLFYGPQMVDWYLTRMNFRGAL